MASPGGPSIVFVLGVVLRFLVQDLVDVCAREIRAQTQQKVTGIDEGITLFVLQNHVGLPNHRNGGRSDREHGPNDFDIVSINHFRALRVSATRVPNVEAELLIGKNQLVLRGVLILINANQISGNCVDRDDRWICQHVILPFLAVLTAVWLHS